MQISADTCKYVHIINCLCIQCSASIKLISETIVFFLVILEHALEDISDLTFYIPKLRTSHEGQELWIHE